MDKLFPTKELFNDYDLYKETNLTKRRFKHSEIETLIKKLQPNDLININNIGKSIEERNIYQIKIGKGDTKVLAWSQMHGDEPTSTMAIFDILNFFMKDDKYNDLRNNLLNNVTIYFIPMLNPDGAEKFKRTNALEVDLNRDALRLRFPESKILMLLRNKLQPEFGFNLHDQNSKYSVGTSGKSAALSFVAPPFDFEKTINGTREKSMKVIADINEKIQKLVPGRTAKYSDEFEPRAFGDNFAKLGTSTILIESGGWNNDPEKQFVRKLNFIALLAGFYSIANETYQSQNVEQYFDIPENQELMFDLKLKNVNVPFGDQKYIVDIGINREECNTSDYSSSFFKGTIVEIGDLSTYGAYETLDCTGLSLEMGILLPSKFESLNEIMNLNSIEYLKKGMLFVKVDKIPEDQEFVNMPINVVSSRKEVANELKIENYANFVLKKGDDVKYAVINGFLTDLEKNEKTFSNGLIFT